MTARKKPAQILEMSGALAHNKKRYAKRIKHEPKPTGLPKKPDNLDEIASDHWDSVVPRLISLRIATSHDVEAIAQMCKAYSDLEQLRSWRPRKNEDKARRITKVSAAHKIWIDLAGRFGMTPSDRAKIVVEPEAKSTKTQAHLA